MPPELIDVAFPKSTCKSYSYYPYATHGSGIGYLTDNTNPVICGGLGYNGINGDETMASCYKLDLMTGEYTFDQHLFNARFYSGPRHVQDSSDAENRHEIYRISSPARDFWE